MNLFLLNLLAVLLALCTGNAELAAEPSKQPPLLSSLYLRQVIEADDTIYELLRQLSIDLNFSTFDSKYDSLMLHLERFLEDYNESSGRVQDSDDRTSKISGNPGLVFRLIFRHVVDLSLIENELRILGSAAALKVLHMIQEADQLKPNSQSLEVASERLFRIIEVYGLDLHHVGNGTYQRISTGFRLERKHFSYLSLQASKTGFHALAMEWAELALETAKDVASVKEAKELLHHVTTKHDTEFESGAEIDETDLKFFLQKLASNEVRSRQLPNHKRAKLHLKYNAACSGKNSQTEEDKAELFCWYERRAHAMWRINPLKTELLSADPLLMQVYDIVNIADAKALISAAEPMLEAIHFVAVDRSTRELKNIKLSTFRSSFNAYPPRSNCNACSALYTKVERLTKLRTNFRGAEDLQLASYTYGGHYLPHDDAIPRYPGRSLPNDVVDNRVATFMVYLGNVDSGGFTAFPNLGVGVRPIFGSGVFWFNLDDDEKIDNRLMHAACPVILGGPKWVGNMWIRLREQFQSLKCQAR